MDKVLLSTGKDDYGTPQHLFDLLDREFWFTIDVCADQYNHKCDRYYTAKDDGLSKSWAGETVFCNPPYSRASGQHKWVKKAYKEAQIHDITVVMLLPARTDTKVFHQFILGKSEIRFVWGRLSFEDCNRQKIGRAPFPSMIVIYHGNKTINKISSFKI